MRNAASAAAAAEGGDAAVEAVGRAALKGRRIVWGSQGLYSRTTYDLR